MNKEFQYCYQCGGHLDHQRVKKIQTWRGELIGVIENVPAWVCNQCGERFYDAEVLKKIDTILKEKPNPKKNITIPAYDY